MIISETICIERWRADSAALEQDIEMLGRVLHDCVHTGASVGFVLPFSQWDAEAYWREKILPGARAGSCCVLVARLGERIVGTVQLETSTMPNQAHRGDVRKLLVHPEARRKGIARMLMLAIEEQARQARRSLLTLDTRTGDSAEPLYLSMGYVAIGAIPRYALNPDRTSLDATTVMYKELPPAFSAD